MEQEREREIRKNTERGKMKQRIFNGGNGWYISASNYKDKTDKAYMNVHFAVCDEPEYKPTDGNPFTFIDIDILEQKYSSYKGKIGLTVFKYELIKPTNEIPEMDKQGKEYATQQIDIDVDSLPFY